MRVLAIIPARGGSKGVPRKNIHLLRGKPLLQYTAEAALAVQGLTRVVLSTEDAEIAAVGRACGLDVPCMRPLELAQDDTPTLPVLQHIVRYLEAAGDRYEAVCLLQPTNPLRTAADIERCLALFETSHADTVFTMLPVPEKYNPHWVYFANEQGELRLSTGEAAPIPRRQQLPPAYHREGSVYVVRRNVLMEQQSLYGAKVLGCPMQAERSVNIDSWSDLQRAEDRLRERESPSPATIRV